MLPLLRKIWHVVYGGKALLLLISVFASALSPMIMGVMIDAGFGLGALLGLNIIVPLAAQFLATVVLQIRR